MIMEACPEAAALLAAAGWKPHDTWHVYTRDTLVMGFQPDGQAFHVKNWGKDVHGPDYPDDPVGAAAWLVEWFKRAANPPTTYATLAPLTLDAPPTEDDMAQPININVAPVFNVGGSHSESGATQSAAEREAIAATEALFNAPPEPEVLPDEIHAPQHPESEQAGEAADPLAGIVDWGTSTAAAEDHGGSEDGAASGGGALQPYDGQDGESVGEREYSLDADYEEIGEELGAELLDVEAESLDSGDPLGMLPPPDPIDFAPDEIALPPEPDQARFYGLDDLDRVRKLRIGDVGAEAAVRIAAIEAEVGERDGEYSAVQSYVVTHLDRHTGMFTPQDDESRATYGRFMDLDNARQRIALVDRKRKDATAFLLTAEREDVVNFSVEAAFG